MSVYLSIHGVKEVKGPEVRVFPRGETAPYARAVVCLETEGDYHELTVFAKEIEQLGVLGAQTMTAAQVARLVLDSLEAAQGSSYGQSDIDAANNIAQALQGVWVKP